ncbi:hypothetical protein ACJ72_06525, partial [Emergomyces africanus]
FGARPDKTTKQGLLILASAIDQARKLNKVLTLVSFDIKGPFNGVNKNTLVRLTEMGISQIMHRLNSELHERQVLQYQI